MKRFLSTAILLFAVMFLASGCSGKNDNEKDTQPSQALYPITIEDTEILLGQTTVQALLDKGMKVTVSTMTEDKQIIKTEIDPEQVLDSNSYYSGGTLWISDSVFAQISMVTDESSIRMGDAVIAYLEINLISGEASELEKISFNGVPVSQISREKAGEMFPDFKGDDNMWFQYGSDYEYMMSFTAENKMLSKFSVKKEYDVDWNSKN